jgi:hypothetical protein
VDEHIKKMALLFPVFMLLFATANVFQLLPAESDTSNEM